MRALVVDDEPNIRRTLSMALESMGFEATNAATGARALDELKTRRFDVMLLDLRFGQESGVDVLKEALRIAPALAVVMMTAFGTIETAVEAMRCGAFDYLPKPCTPEQLRQVLSRIQKTRKLERRVAELESRLDADSPEVDLTTHSPAMEKAFEVAFKAAGTDATVLLLGESGTGKSREWPRHAAWTTPRSGRLSKNPPMGGNLASWAKRA
jgi:NtrC-family two-component system response regulator AlgB